MRKISYKGDVCIIKSQSNLFYLTGYDTADAIIALVGGKAYYFTDARYFEEVDYLKTDFVIESVEKYGAFLRESGFRSAAIEKSMPAYDYEELKNAGITDFSYIDEEMTSLRMIKSAEEIEVMQKAQDVSDRAFLEILPKIHEGMTERELAGQLEGLLFACGGDALAFTSIVAFGENTSKPHAHRTEKKLGKGMPVTMDFGAKYAGYCSDMTRTVFFGEPSNEIKKTYMMVKEAQSMAIAGVHPGMTGRECDEIARGYFRRNGVDKYFLHSLGHSLGIDIHESPNFSPRCESVIRTGMTLSVEPGLYFDKKFGIRIEDVIYFAETGVRNLTKSAKDMIIL
ncbi:MAG: aminopeptidase P family protein [Clostridia bacterium]|nr:aminopeptidase P family protein [Clostridia bacterium]